MNIMIQVCILHGAMPHLPCAAYVFGLSPYAEAGCHRRFQRGSIFFFTSTGGFAAPQLHQPATHLAALRACGLGSHPLASEKQLSPLCQGRLNQWLAPLVRRGSTDSHLGADGAQFKEGEHILRSHANTTM